MAHLQWVEPCVFETEEKNQFMFQLEIYVLLWEADSISPGHCGQIQIKKDIL